jgi:hypothetical protein
MAKLTEQQQNELNERNAKIYKMYCNLSEQQPLAYRQTIITYLSKEFNLSPQMISLIIKSKEQSNENN